MPPSSQETPYVLVIHGTWNPAVPGVKTWHELDDQAPGNFCHRLNESLFRLGMGRPVWAHPTKKELHFSWSGFNTHEARIEAAIAFLALLLEIEELDQTARIHVVAHSHGCNVVLAAVHEPLRGQTTKNGANILPAASKRVMGHALCVSKTHIP